MSFKASEPAPAIVFQEVTHEIRSLRAYARELVVSLPGNSVSMNQIIDVMETFNNAITNLETAYSNPNMEGYVLTQWVNKDKAAITADFNALHQAAVDVRQAAKDIITVDANGYITKDKIVSYSLAVDTATPLDTTALVAALKLFIDEVD